DARGRARRGAGYDRGRVRAVPAPARLPATNAARTDRHRTRAGARAHAVGAHEPLLSLAPDVFVLRRVSPGRFVHLGGSGRGEGWAGIVEASLEDDASFAQALKSEQPVRIERDAADRIFGPYYARSAAIVPVSHDAVVVFGSPSDPIGAEDGALVAAAAEVNESLEPAGPAKQLAEQLYLLEATGLARGVLLVAHTDAAPRGFTLLCRQLGARVAEVASTVLGFGLTREWTAAESARLQSEFAALEG